jgi:hypothetical protein
MLFPYKPHENIWYICPTNRLETLEVFWFPVFYHVSPINSQNDFTQFGKKSEIYH